MGLFTEQRMLFHASLLSTILTIDQRGVPTNADKDSSASKAIAHGILNRVGSEVSGIRLSGQRAGRQFEVICKEYLERTFTNLDHLRPGKWLIESLGRGRRSDSVIAKFEQYTHLKALALAAANNRELAAALGNDYIISPDVIISRTTEDDDFINARVPLVDDQTSRLASLRRRNGGTPLLHASISCKWTIRSDRSQNSRSEALNLIRNRKGHLPHIVVVTGEPLPARIASIALGTGDVDCIYHFALTELIAAVEELNYPDAEELLGIMVGGKRLKDISDLPLDLAV